MAVRIPVYEQQTAPTTAGINVRVPNVQVDDSVGRALVGLGRVGQEAALAINKEIAEGEAREADNAAVASIDAVLYDPDNGYLGTAGKDAIDRAEAALKELERLRSDGGKSIKTGLGRRMFERTIESRISAATRSVQSHAMQQTRVYNVGQAKARSALAQNAAVNEWANPEQYEINKGVMLEEAAFGLDGAAANVARMEALQGLHAGVLNRMIAQEQFSSARDYFDRKDVQAEMPESMKTEVLAKLRTAGVKTESLDVFLGLSGTSAEKRQTLEERYRSGNISAEVYDASIQRVNAAEDQAEQDRVLMNREMSGQAQSWILDNPSKPLTDMPVELQTWARESGSYDDLNRFKYYMGDPPANPQMYRQVRMMEPVAFAQYFDQNAEQLRTKVSRAEFSALQNYRIALQDNNVRTVQATALTNQTINAVKRDLAAAGINMTAKGSGQAAEKLQLFEAELLLEIDAFTQANNGFAPTKDQMAAMARSLLLSGEKVEEGAWFNPDVMRFEVPRDQREKLFKPDDPALLERLTEEQTVQQDPYKFGVTYKDANGVRRVYMGNGAWGTP